MSRAKLSRESKRQLGQFLTPDSIATAIVRQLGVSQDLCVLEPSLGKGAFAFALLDALRPRLGDAALSTWAQTNLHGCEIDRNAYLSFGAEWARRGLGELPPNIENVDFFRWLPGRCHRGAALDRRLYFRSPLETYDLILGNPPFGASIDPDIQDPLDRIFGMREGFKIKKETYAFFLVKCMDLLKPGGRLCFICSDTILTIPTMKGLRHLLQNHCDVDIGDVPGAFEETAQDMVLVTLTRSRRKPAHVVVFGNPIPLTDIERTRNLSWRLNPDYARYFTGETLGDLMVASSGMTVGNNALFVRDIDAGRIFEPYDFAMGTELITLKRELERARLGQISSAKRQAILEREARGDTRPMILWTKRETPALIQLPHHDYRYYNKATSAIVYAAPQCVIFWRNDGEYVYTFKKSGHWYLHGVGGKPYFGREGLTWALISNRLRTRWLPEGYILDSGAPCAFLREGVAHDELFFIMGWTLTDLCTQILKNVINHTRNIQSKDFERLPYPRWVASPKKEAAVGFVQQLIRDAREGRVFDFNSGELVRLNEFYEYPQDDEALNSLTQSVGRVARLRRNVRQPNQVPKAATAPRRSSARTRR